MSVMADTEWAKKYPEKHAAKSKRWADRNREKVREAQRRWRESNPEKYAEIQRTSANRRRAKLIAEMIEAYGGGCSCCGETNPLFLTLEHIGGLAGRPRVNTETELKRLKREGWPPTATCFCMNCNLGSWRNGGICPHDEDDVVQGEIA